MKKYIFFSFFLITYLPIYGMEISATGPQAEKNLLNTLLADELTTEKLDQFIADGNDINFRTADGQTLLHIAVRFNKAHNIPLLIQQGANINVQDRLGQTPLYVAINNNNEAAAKILLDVGADATLATNLGITPLAAAQSVGNANLINLLEEALPNKPQKEITEPSPTTRETFIRKKAWDAERELFNLLAQNDLSPKKLIKLLGQGANINAKNSRGQTPLHIAVAQDNPRMINLFLEHGADVHAFDNNNTTPLQLAKNLKRENIVKLLSGEEKLFNLLYQNIVSLQDLLQLIRQGIDINAKNLAGQTPLHYAIQLNNFDAAKNLIALGADVHSIDSNGNTPLHLAVIQGNVEIVNLLLGHGAASDRLMVNDQGATPLTLAAASGREDIFPLLFQEVAEESPISNEGRRLLLESLEALSSNIPIIIPSAPVNLIPITSKKPTQQPTTQPASNLSPDTIKKLLAEKRGTPAANSYAWLYATTLGGTLLAYLGYKNLYEPQTVPTKLTKYSLNILLTTALKNKQYEYAHQLVLQNSPAVRRLAIDEITKDNLEDLIFNAEQELIKESASSSSSLNPFERFGRPTLSTQLKHLADLHSLIERSA
jgi:cytohesin